MKKNSTGYTLDHGTQTIVMTKAFAKHANIITTTEYSTLVTLLRDLPGYTAKVKTITIAEEKRTYNGLTLEEMEKYIKEWRADDADRLLAEMKEMAEFGATHRCKYGFVKKWFFENCKEYKAKAMYVKTQEDTTTGLATTHN